MSRKPTKAEREHMGRVAQLGCIVPDCHGVFIQVHHALTGMGGRRNHMKVLPLCYRHHQGEEGIHTLGRKAWQRKHGSEADLLDMVNLRLEELYERT